MKEAFFFSTDSKDTSISVEQDATSLVNDPSVVLKKGSLPVRSQKRGGSTSHLPRREPQSEERDDVDSLLSIDNFTFSDASTFDDGMTKEDRIELDQSDFLMPGVQFVDSINNWIFNSHSASQTSSDVHTSDEGSRISTLEYLSDAESQTLLDIHSSDSGSETSSEEHVSDSRSLISSVEPKDSDQELTHDKASKYIRQVLSGIEGVKTKCVVSQASLDFIEEPIDDDISLTSHTDSQSDSQSESDISDHERSKPSQIMKQNLPEFDRQLGYAMQIMDTFSAWIVDDSDDRDDGDSLGTEIHSIPSSTEIKNDFSTTDEATNKFQRILQHVRKSASKDKEFLGLECNEMRSCGGSVSSNSHELDDDLADAIMELVVSVPRSSRANMDQHVCSNELSTNSSRFWNFKRGPPRSGATATCTSNKTSILDSHTLCPAESSEEREMLDVPSSEGGDHKKVLAPFVHDDSNMYRGSRGSNQPLESEVVCSSSDKWKTADATRAEHASSPYITAFEKEGIERLEVLNREANSVGNVLNVIIHHREGAVAAEVDRTTSPKKLTWIKCSKVHSLWKAGLDWKKSEKNKDGLLSISTTHPLVNEAIVDTDGLDVTRIENKFGDIKARVSDIFREDDFLGIHKIEMKSRVSQLEKVHGIEMGLEDDKEVRPIKKSRMSNIIRRRLEWVATLTWRKEKQGEGDAVPDCCKDPHCKEVVGEMTENRGNPECESSDQRDESMENVELETNNPSIEKSLEDYQNDLGPKVEPLKAVSASFGKLLSFFSFCRSKIVNRRPRAMNAQDEEVSVMSNWAGNDSNQDLSKGEVITNIESYMEYVTPKDRNNRCDENVENSVENVDTVLHDHVESPEIVRVVSGVSAPAPFPELSIREENRSIVEIIDTVLHDHVESPEIVRIVSGVSAPASFPDLGVPEGNRSIVETDRSKKVICFRSLVKTLFQLKGKSAKKESKIESIRENSPADWLDVLATVRQDPDPIRIQSYNKSFAEPSPTVNSESQLMMQLARRQLRGMA